MINRNRLIRHADDDGVSAATVERDYVLTHALCAIASQPEAQRMIFKGGTALRMCHFEDYRYSADLDFSLLDGLDSAAAREAVARALRNMRASIDMPHAELDEAVPPRIRYVGPLGRERQIKLDLAEDELVIEHEPRTLLARYADQPGDIQIDVYTLREIAAEKLRCVIQRQQCRDLFDLYELLEGQHVELWEVWPSLERKARHRHVDPALFSERLEQRLPSYERLWEQEMAEHVTGEPPPFDTVSRVVRRHLRKQLRH
jgi:predicted nucleotidyltransferase component of viral defense system